MLWYVAFHDVNKFACLFEGQLLINTCTVNTTEPNVGVAWGLSSQCWHNRKLMNTTALEITLILQLLHEGTGCCFIYAIQAPSGNRKIAPKPDQSCLRFCRVADGGT